MDELERTRLEGLPETGPEYEVPEELAPRPDVVMDGIYRWRRVLAAVLVLLALVSALPLAEVFSRPETYAATIETLDEKKANVTALVASSTGLSAAITAIPDDVGTPVADKLMDVSSDLGIVLMVIYLEKYLLTIFGLAAFRVLVPVGCALLVVSLLLMRRSAVTGPLARLGVKALLMAVVLFAVVPASVAVTDMVDRTYEVSAQAQAAAEQGADDAGEQSQEEGDGSILDFITGIPEMLADGVSSLTDEVLDQVNRLIESLAVMIVTSCVIPVVVLLFFMWAANALLGVDMSGALGAARGRVRGAARSARRQAQAAVVGRHGGSSR